jgi:hypothetical protein
MPDDLVNKIHHSMMKNVGKTITKYHEITGAVMFACLTLAPRVSLLVRSAHCAQGAANLYLNGTRAQSGLAVQVETGAEHPACSRTWTLTGQTDDKVGRPSSVLGYVV